MTSSGHHLDGSHVSRAGHWVDLVVKLSKPVSNEELQALEELAQAIDPRPVRARRAGRAAT
jgi:hypothetical protein